MGPGFSTGHCLGVGGVSSASVNAGLLHNPKSFSVSLHSISFVKVVKVIVQASNLPLFTRRPKIVT